MSKRKKPYVTFIARNGSSVSSPVFGILYKGKPCCAVKVRAYDLAPKDYIVSVWEDSQNGDYDWLTMAENSYHTDQEELEARRCYGSGRIGIFVIS